MGKKYGSKVDANQGEIVKILLQVPGVSVFDLSNAGQGVGDILVGWRKCTWLFEIKAPKKRKKLTPAQVKFRDGWTGQYHVVESAHEALAIMGVLR